MASTTNRAIFLDRDGVINIDTGYTHRVDDFAFVPGAARAIRRANEADYKVLVVTNQGGIGLGYYDHDAVALFHHHMLAMLAEEGAHITDIAYCPHHPNAVDPADRSCDCRKPSPKMILDLARRHDINPGLSAMIGDRASDIEAATAAGAEGFLFDGGDLDALMAEILARLSEASDARR